MKILTEFASTVSASQRNQVAKLLQEGGEAGSFENSQAFRDKLIDLSNMLEEISVPLFTFFLVVGHEVVDSGRLNKEFRLMQLDMETIYEELSAMQDAVLGHQTLMDQKIIDTKNSLAALDTRITTLELLSDEVDFNLAFVNTFNALGAGTLNRADPEAETLYVDDRLNDKLGQDFELDVDVRKEGLVLPIIEQEQIPIIGVELLEGEDSTASDLDVDPTDNSLFNLLEENDDKYWVRSVLLLDQDAFHNPITPPQTGIKASLRLLLGGFQSVNNITLVPWTDLDICIEQIQYKALDGSFFDLLSGPVVLTDKATLVFNTVETDELILQLTQKSYTELIDFNFDTAPENVQTVRSLSGQATAFNVDLSFGATTGYAKGYLYSIGLDFIGVAESSFRERGIYVSDAFDSTQPVVEVGFRATVQHSTNTVGSVQDAVEFRLVKLNFNADNVLLYTENVPLRIANDLIQDEVLLIDSTGVGTVRFFPVLSSLSVFRDGTVLVAGTDYTLSVDNGLTFTTTGSGTPVGPPIALKVKITDPLNTSNYTLNYTIAVAHPTLTGEVVYLNSIRSALVAPNTIRFLVPAQFDDVAYSRMFVKIIARSFDLLSNRPTPVVADYALLVKEQEVAV